MGVAVEFEAALRHAQDTAMLRGRLSGLTGSHHIPGMPHSSPSPEEHCWHAPADRVSHGVAGPMPMSRLFVLVQGGLVPSRDDGHQCSGSSHVSLYCGVTQLCLG